MKLNKNTVNGIAVNFGMVFPNEKPLPAKEYLKGISKAFLIDFVTSYLAIDHLDDEKAKIETVISDFFCKQNHSFATGIYANILRFKAQKKAEAGKEVTLYLLNPLTSLNLYELLHDHNELEITIDNVNLERQLFKLYVLLNEEQHKNEYIAAKSTEHLEFDMQMSMMAFCQSFYQFDILNYDHTEVFMTQCVKAILLFEFLEKEEKAKSLMQGLLDRFKCNSWEEYLRILSEIAMVIYTNTKPGHLNITVDKEEDNGKYEHFMDQLIINDLSKLDEYDYLSIRTSPFYKVEPGVYRLVFKLFLTEKIFKGLYFLLNEINIKVNKDKEWDDRYKIKDFRPVYCDLFSEQILLYTFCNRMFEKGFIKYEGREINKMGVKGEPDYYARKGSNIFIFESKDFYTRKQIKHSYDFEKYNQEFKKRLYGEVVSPEKVDNGAVLQLVETIRRLHNKSFPSEFDNKYNKNQIYIYPIIVVHDNLYNTFGLNNLVNSWFEEELIKLKEEGVFIERIKPITIINIDVLLMYQDNFYTGKLKLNEVLDEYFKFTKKFKRRNCSFDVFEKQMQNRVMPFAFFIQYYGKEKKANRLPALIEQKVNKIASDRRNNN